MLDIGLLFTLFAAFAAQEPRPAASTSRAVAFVGGRVFDGTGRPASEATVVVRDGRVEAVGPAASTPVPAGAERIDLRGKTLLPGLINVHGHVGETVGLRSGPELYDAANVERQLLLYARYGVTSALSLGGDQKAGFELRDRQEQRPPAHARLFVAGPVIAAESADAARAEVDKVAPLKPDFVKIRVDDNLGSTAKMPAAVYRAVIGRAHEHGLRVAVHIFYLDDAKRVLEAGADLIAHSVRDQPVDAELIALLKKRDTCLVPTLTREVSTFAYESEPPFFSEPFFLRFADKATVDALRSPERQAAMRGSRAAQQYKVALEVAKRNLKALGDAGVRIAFGTDSGPPARFQGYFEHMELELMAQAGLTPAQVMKSATGDAARCLGQPRLGTLAPGNWADLVVFAQDPLADVKNSRSLDAAWIAGKPVERR